MFKVYYTQKAGLFANAIVQLCAQVCDSPLMPTGRAEKDKEITEFRVGMDELAFTALWAEGRAMTMEQAIEYALE